MAMKIKKIGVSNLFFISFFLLSSPIASAQGSQYHQFLYPEYSKKVSMDFKDADLRSVLKIFSQQSGMNFIAAGDIANEKVTLFFENVPVEQALERILSANNLMYEVEPGSDIFVVKKIARPQKDLITRVYVLKNATVFSSQLTTNREYSTTETEGSSSSDSTSSSSSSTSSTSSSSSSGSTGSSSSAESLEGISAIIKNILTEDGKILEDPRTNSLVITDIPSQFPIIEKTIAKLDAPVPQILIEVEMIDISKRTSDLLGVKYGSTLLAFTGAQRATFYPWDENKLLSTGQGIIDPVDRYTAGVIDASGMSAVLQFLKTQTDTKTLATPKILTLNNQMAKIAISTNEAIGIKTTTGGAEGITTQSVEAERAATGVFLTVTPQVNEQTGEITMAVVPLVAEARTGATFGTQTFRDPEVRGSNTILRIKDNETIYIGGLKKTVTSETITKLPVLGDLPLIGGAFRHKGKDVEERELIIFITPKIIADKNYVAPNALAADLKTREQDYPQAKRLEIEKALLITEQQRKK